MYIRKTTRKYKGKTYTNYLLVESHHTAQGPRQKVVCSLGDLKPRPRDAWLKLARTVEAKLSGQTPRFDAPDEEAEAIVRKVKERKPANRTQGGGDRHRDKANDLVAVPTDGVIAERHRKAGSVHVGYPFWKRLGLDEILADGGLTARARALTCVMTMNRLVHPSRELAMPDWWRSRRRCWIRKCTRHGPRCDGARHSTSRGARSTGPAAQLVAPPVDNEPKTAAKKDAEAAQPTAPEEVRKTAGEEPSDDDGQRVQLGVVCW